MSWFPLLEDDIPLIDKPLDPTRRRILVLTGSVGAGHDSAAYELRNMLQSRGAYVEVQDYIDALPLPIRFLYKESYGPTIQYAPWAFELMFALLEYTLVQYCVIYFLGVRPSLSKVEKWVQGFDSVVSTYPVASQALGVLRSRNLLDVTTFTYLTDPAFHQTWFHNGIDVYATPYVDAISQAPKYHVEVNQVRPLVGEKFSKDTTSTRIAMRQHLGIHSTELLIVIVSGSLGIGKVSKTVSEILRRPGTRVLILCGHNEDLRMEMQYCNGVIALGWRMDLEKLYAAADVMVHNAGGMSFAEALVIGLPVVMYLPIPGHGRANASELARWGAVSWPKTPEELHASISDAVTQRSRVRLGNQELADLIMSNRILDV
jgi:UDP-N-acetylglucosamine:LPS N-acetylglucosamine transferase